MTKNEHTQREANNLQDMRTVHKYSLPDEIDVDNSFTIMMPNDADILCIKSQDGKPVMYAEVETDNELIKLKFRVVITGRKIPENTVMEYVGTFIHPSGKPVYHLYEEFF